MVTPPLAALVRCYHRSYRLALTCKSVNIACRLPLLVGLQQAKRLLLFGEDLNATQALSLNLVTEVAEDPLQRCNELAFLLVQRSCRSLSSIKICIETGAFPNAENNLRTEVDAANWCFSYKGAMDAFSKFQKRRTPDQAAARDETLVSLLIRASSVYSEKPFLRFGGVDVSYRQFARDVACLAGGLSSAGIQQGDVVGAMMLNSEHMVRCWFATMWIGAIWAPLHVSVCSQPQPLISYAGTLRQKSEAWFYAELSNSSHRK